MGEVAEWSKANDSKSFNRWLFVGSNPARGVLRQVQVKSGDFKVSFFMTLTWVSRYRRRPEKTNNSFFSWKCLLVVFLFFRYVFLLFLTLQNSVYFSLPLRKWLQILTEFSNFFPCNSTPFRFGVCIKGSPDWEFRVV